MRGAWWACIVLTLFACRRKDDAATVAPPAPSQSTAPSSPAPQDACLASCRAGLCNACPETTFTFPKPSSEVPQQMAVAGTRVVWDYDGNQLSVRDLCAATTSNVSCSGGCVYWSMTPSGLTFIRGAGVWRWSEGKEERVASRVVSGRFQTAANGDTCSVEGWFDEISLPHKAGWMLTCGHEQLSGDTKTEFVLDGNDVYFVDGPSIMHAALGTKAPKPSTVFTSTTAFAPAPILRVGATLYAVTGWSQSENFSGEPFTLSAVHDGKSDTIYSTAKGAGCFAANTTGALVCVDRELVFVPFDRTPQRTIATVDRAAQTSYDHPAVALGDDGEFVWTTPSEHGVIHVRRPACAPVDGAAVVERWNAAHNAHDAAALSTLYAPQVSFYGATLTNAECVARKRAAFAATADYGQSIRDVTTSVKDGHTTIRFIKTSSSGGKQTDYKALIVLDGESRIIEERDDAAH